jgi:hypothetical protein
MLSEAELLHLFKSSESHWVERKPPGVGRSEIRNTLVAFANSVSEGQHAVLFIGVSDDGKVQGVDNADKEQKTVTRIAEQECYPPVKCNPTAIRVAGVELVAVVVGASGNRPHFSGQAYVRVGSETRKASPPQFEELIACRNDKVRRILREKDTTVTVVWRGENAPNPHLLGGVEYRSRPAGACFEGECVITACDSLVLHFRHEPTERAFSAPMDKVTLSYDHKSKRTKLFINF